MYVILHSAKQLAAMQLSIYTLKPSCKRTYPCSFHCDTSVRTEVIWTYDPCAFISYCTFTVFERELELGISVVCPGRALGHQRQLLPYSIWAKVKIEVFELISWQMQLHVFSKTDDPPIV